MARKIKPPAGLAQLNLLWDAETKAATEYHKAPCPGCREHPDPGCAACGRPTAIIRPNGQHPITWCARCWRLVKSIRLEARAECSTDDTKATPQQIVA